MGATRATFETVVACRYEGWIDDQFALPRATSPWDGLVANDQGAVASINVEPGFDVTMWHQRIAEPDRYNPLDWTQGFVQPSLHVRQSTSVVARNTGLRR